MLRSKYLLDIISHHPQFKEKNLRKYNVDGIETIGAWGDEPFEIRFKNSSSKKVQVKISVDGTDVLTAKLANTEISKDMWVVEAYATLALKAWPETNKGGARFVFTSADNSVAGHTHGDLTNRGIIAAAVYEESHQEPIRLTYDIGDWGSGGNWGAGSGSTYSGGTIGGNYFNSDNHRSENVRSKKGLIEQQSYNSNDSLSLNDSDSRSLESLVAVGAGQHVEQKITYVTGLIKPKFAETVKVRYLWWDELVSKLKEQCPTDVHPSGFPGDKEHKIMSIGKTPRINTSLKKSSAPQQLVFSRF